MKKLRCFFAPFCLALLVSCNTSKISTGEVNYLSNTEQGTLLVSAAGYGTSKALAIANAEAAAFKNLIFRGIPGTQYHLPIMENEASARQQHSSYFAKLLDGPGYKSFMMLSEEMSAYSPARKNQKTYSSRLKSMWMHFERTWSKMELSANLAFNQLSIHEI